MLPKKGCCTRQAEGGACGATRPRAPHHAGRPPPRPAPRVQIRVSLDGTSNSPKIYQALGKSGGPCWGLPTPHKAVLKFPQPRGTSSALPEPTECFLL